MNAIAAVSHVLKSLPRSMDREALRTAHRHAEDFHAAMVAALEAETEIEDAVADLRKDPCSDAWRTDRNYWQDKYTESLGKAAASASLMPAIWLSILGVNIQDCG